MGTSVSAATTDAEHPECIGKKVEGNSKPGDDLEVGTECGGDTVVLDIFLDGMGNDRGQDRRDDNCGNEEETGDPSKNVGHTAAPAAANGENTSDKLENSGSKGNAKGNEDIFRRSTIGIHVLVQVTGEEILELRFIGTSNVGQLPDFDGVEPEIGRGLRTERRVKVFAVLPGNIAITVAQQSYRVEVLDIQLVLGFFQHLSEVLVFGICADSLEEIGKFIGSF